jgi:hypothetical protein
MAGTLTISQLSDGFNSTSSTNCIQGSAKAWVNFNGTGTVAIRASYNVSSITDNGTGDYTINFTNALADINYSAIGSAGTTGTDPSLQYFVSQKDTGNRTTTSVRFISTQHGTEGNWGPNPADVSQFNIAIFR